MPKVDLDNSGFSGWRAFLWPVHSYELKKLIPMLLIFFLVYFDYNILRIMKDTLVVTANDSGAEVIPFIKLWVMFPGAVLMTYLFTLLSSRLNQEKVFYTMVSIFLVYFFIFTFFLYPSRESLHPNAFADTLQTILPEGCKGFIAMFRNWTLTSFYVMSELWSNIILTMLFWGFANQVTRLSEAKRFYGLFGIGGNLSGIIAGQASVYISKHIFNPSLPFGETAWEQSMMMLVMIVIVTGLLTMILFRWLNKNVLTDAHLQTDQSIHEKNPKGTKPRVSLKEAVSYLMHSRYMIYIAIIVVSYNIVINLVEVIWKHQVHELFPNPSDYNIYMNNVSSVIGIIATLSALFVSGNAIRMLGWTFTAMMTPVILLFTCIGFFIFFFAKEFSIISILGATPLAMVVFFGSIQNILSRGAKYSVFDATKEMAFVPLSKENQIKGKAVIDGVCSRLGKSGGSFIHQTLLILFSSLAASAPYVAGFLLSVILVWTIATRLLGKEFIALTDPEKASSFGKLKSADTEKIEESSQIPVMLDGLNLKEQQAV